MRYDNLGSFSSRLVMQEQNEIVSLFEKQEGQCPLCEDKLSKAKGKSNSIVVDSCPGCFETRGLVCHSCNSSREDPALANNWDQYIEQYKAESVWWKMYYSLDSKYGELQHK